MRGWVELKPSDYETLPTVSFVVPNQANDMHDGSRNEGDTWVRKHLDGFVDVARLSGLADDVERQLEEARTGSPRAVEPPSPAELAVLRLLASELTQREIGSELFLSMNTVKTHTRNLYGKLGVRSREEAVRQANVLGLLVCADSPG